MNKVLLIVLDGYGEGKDYPGNAVTRAKTPFLKAIRKNYPMALLKCKGTAVGLPKNSMGGSEVGHYTIGAGRVVLQKLEEINQSIKKKNFFKKKALLKAMKKKTIHLIGMISDTGIHSHLNHVLALIKMAKQQKVNNIFIHCITDGRDVAERSAKKYIRKIQKSGAKIASIVGRYYAMDRDKNWNRTKKAFDLITKGKGFPEDNPVTAIDHAYKRGDETDYYIQPMILNKEGIIKKEDAVIFFNFRTDRARQLTQKLEEGTYNVTCLGQYAIKAPVVFPEKTQRNNLGETLEKAKKKQLRIAETEKYAHVTYFFNSQRLKPFKGEERTLVPSPKCPSYADKPEMNAKGITREGIKALKRAKHDFIFINYANPDLVGHAGEFKAAIKAVETTDASLSKLIPVAEKAGYHIIVTADHGNAEEMKYPDGSDKPSHSLNPVPCWVISPNYKVRQRRGELCNIAPTILDMMNLKKPKEMACKSLVG